VYNGDQYLREVLDSILSQTFADFELIISDNSSTDGTQAICCDYAATDLRIRYHKNHTNLGAARNFNKVFELARAPYFRWATADDLFAPESLTHCVSVLDDHPEVVLCYPKTVLIDQNGNFLKPYEDNLDLRQPSPLQRFGLARQRIGLVNVIYGLIRADKLRRTSLVGNYSGADIILIMELTLYGQFFEIPKPLFFRRMHAKASSSLTSAERIQEFLDPRTKGQPWLRLWRHQIGYLIAILHAPLSAGEKIKLTASMVRFAVSSREELLMELAEALRYCAHKLYPSRQTTR